MAKFMQTFTVQQLKPDSLSGMGWAIAILGLWMFSFIGACAADLTPTAWGWIAATVMGRTFLQTGLFIIAHDAMHGNLLPEHKVLNDWMGDVAVSLYAGLSYSQCCINHTQHHRHPAQIGDPDFHDGVHRHPVLWYFIFLRSYLSLRSVSILFLSGSLMFLGMDQIFHTSVIHLMLFWILPLFLSSMQLFFFGTYLPHRQESKSVALHSSKPFLEIWSFLSCYHFGAYHWEHHQYPKTPWYRLPQRRSKSHVKSHAKSH